MKKNATRSDSHVRAPDFAERIAGVQFPPEVWAVFAQCDAPRSTAEIARRAKLDETVVVSALRRLARRRLVQKNSAQKNQLDWQGYLNAQAGEPAPVGHVAPSVEPEPAPAPVIVPAVTPAPVAAPAASEPVPAASAIAPAASVAPAAETPVVASTPEPLVEFVVDNSAAAAARQSAVREVLCFTVGKAPASSGRPVLAA